MRSWLYLVDVTKQYSLPSLCTTTGAKTLLVVKEDVHEVWDYTTFYQLAAHEACGVSSFVCLFVCPHLSCAQ